MTWTRRTTLKFGAAGLAGLGATKLMPFSAGATGKGGDAYPLESGELSIHPVAHASLVLAAPDLTIYADPVGGPESYAQHPPADLILVTHEHGDHFDAETLSALAGEETRLIVNPAVHGMLPEALKGKARALGNGESAVIGSLQLEAIPAYNTTPERMKYHPRGRDNGYVLTLGGRRIYIAGDTEDIPEMRALENIHIAFVPMNLPYTMDIDQASDAVAAFEPDFVYPYHYRGQDPEAFAAKVTESGATTKVIQGSWYG